MRIRSFPKGCAVTRSIIDPLTGEPAVRLTTGQQDANGCMVVFSGEK